MNGQPSGGTRLESLCEAILRLSPRARRALSIAVQGIGDDSGQRAHDQ